MMIQTTDLAGGVTTCSGGIKVKEEVGSREPHGFPRNLQEAHPLQEDTVHMNPVDAVYSIQTRQRFLGKVATLG